MVRKLRRIARQIWALLYYGVLCYVVDRPKRVAFINSVLAFHERDRLAQRSPSLEFSEIFRVSSELRVSLGGYTAGEGKISFPEFATLTAIVRVCDPGVIFEFGTGDGTTTLQFAKHSRPDAKVYTIDLPPASPRPRLATDPGDRMLIGRKDVGIRFRATPFERKIHQLLEDSALLDTQNLRNQVNLVFIDGAHSYEYASNDTAKALEMVAPGGTIVWHDYMVWNQVTDFLNELSHKLPLRHIKGTSLVVYRHP
jgi:hypothetical protein